MHNPIKYGWKKIISSVDVVKTVISDYISPHCDPELEDSKPIFLHDTLAHNDASPNQVWLQNIQQLRRYHQDQNLLQFLTFSVTLTLTTTANSIFFTRQSSLWCCLPANQVHLQKDQQFRRHIRKSSFDYIIFHCDLGLEDSKSIFLEDNLAHNDASPYQV